MKQKLASKGDFSDLQIEMTLDLLMQKNLIDDYEYTRNYLQKANRLSIGINKAVDNLKKDGVSPFVIDECLEVYSSEMEYEKALSLIQKLFDENTARSPKALVQNIRNRLFNKGFSQNVVDQAINDFSFDIPKSHTKMLLKKEYDKNYKIVEKLEKEEKKRQKSTNP